MKRIFSCSSSQVPAESWSRRDQKLLEAVERGDVSRVATLATSKRARPAKLNAAGQSAFHLAAAKGLPECLRLLLAHGAPIDERNLEGSTALHLATIACQPQCVKVLLQHGANEGHVDGQERTPLHWAASSGCASSVLLLCDHEAVLDVTDARGQTPLMLAAGGNHAAICAQLLRRGADPHLADKDNKTALALARECGSLESAELLLRYEGTLGGDKAPEPRWHPGGTGNGPGLPAARGQGTGGGDNEEEEDEELEVMARKEQEGHQEVADAVTLREPGQEGDKDEDDGGGKGDKDDRGGTQHPEELRKRKTVEEGEKGTQGHVEGDTVSPFLAWLGTECSELREVTTKARRWAQGLRGELEGTLRNKLEREVVAAATLRRSLVAWEKLVASLERALTQTHRSHGEILQRCRILLENSWNGTEPPGSKGLGGGGMETSHLKSLVGRGMETPKLNPLVGGGMETPHPNSLVGGGMETPKLNPLVGGGMETPHPNSLVGGGMETPKLNPLVGGGMETPKLNPLVGGGLGAGGASRKLEEEVVELRENNGNLVEELGRLRGQRRRLREELGRLRGGAGGGGGEVRPGRSQVATVATISTHPGRVAGRGGGEGEEDGEGVLGELQQKLEGLVRTQQQVLRLVTEMEGEEVGTGTAGLAPGDGPEPPGPPNQPLEPPGDGPEPPGPPNQPLEPPGDGPEPPGPPNQPLEPPEEVLKPPGPPEQPPEPPLGWWQWQEVAVVAQERVAHLEQVLARLRERAGEREGTLKRLLGQTERLSAEVLGLRGQSAHLQLQIELQQKNHREIVAVYRSHLLSAAQGLMDPRVFAVLLQILRGPGGVAGEDPTPRPLCQ